MQVQSVQELDGKVDRMAESLGAKLANAQAEVSLLGGRLGAFEKAMQDPSE